MQSWLCLFFVLITSNCFADTILLKSGKTIEAKIVERNDKEIKIDFQDEWLPKYLSKIPSGPFNNLAPLQYKKTDKGYLLYSFGPDRMDQSGQVIFDSSPAAKDTSGDIVFSFE